MITRIGQMTLTNPHVRTPSDPSKKSSPKRMTRIGMVLWHPHPHVFPPIFMPSFSMVRSFVHTRPFADYVFHFIIPRPAAGGKTKTRNNMRVFAVARIRSLLLRRGLRNRDIPHDLRSDRSACVHAPDTNVVTAIDACEGKRDPIPINHFGAGSDIHRISHAIHG